MTGSPQGLAPNRMCLRTVGRNRRTLRYEYAIGVAVIEMAPGDTTVGSTPICAILSHAERRAEQGEDCERLNRTGEPNELVAQIHPRMPVILPAQHHAAWLGETDDGNLKALLVPYPADQMRMWEISPRVNSPKNDDPSLWEPLHGY
jgi:hypothetical protein